MSSPELIDLPVVSEVASAGDLTVLGLAIAQRDRSLDGLQRDVPELTGSGYDEPHIPLIEAFAGISAQVLYRIAQLPDALIAEALTSLGVVRREASAASVDVFLTGAPDQDVTLVTGTLFQSGRVPFQLARTVTVPAGAQAYGPVPLIAKVRGPVGNVKANSTWTQVTPTLLSDLRNPQPAQGGAYAQSREEFVTFAREVFGAWGTSSRAGDAVALASFVPGVERVLALEHTLLTNGARWGAFAWGERPFGGGRVNRAREGLMTLVVRAYGGGYLPSEIERRVTTALESTRVQGTRLVVTSPEEVTVNVSVTVRPDPVMPDAVVQSAVRAAVQAFLSGSTWVWGAPLFASDVRTAAQVEGVRSVLHVGLEVAGTSDDLYRLTYEAGGLSGVAPNFPNVLFRAGTVEVVTL